MPAKPKAVEELEHRVTGEYIANQTMTRRRSATHQAHKDRIARVDRIYAGDLSDYRANGDSTPKDYLLIENKFKNFLHDIMRLAAEPRPTPVFPQLGPAKTEATAARVREQAADTIWEMGVNGPRIQRRLYMDQVGAGYMAVAMFQNGESPYAQGIRLNPRYCYPNILNGVLQDMLYVETMTALQAKRQWPDLQGQLRTEDHKDVTIVQYWDKYEACQAVLENATKSKAGDGYVVERWEHELGCVPVAFVAMDTFDDEFRGLGDQVGGPMALRNRTMSFLEDYMEEMVHAPYRMKNVLNADDLPGPLTVYQIDPQAEDWVLDRVPPAAPAGAVFGTLQYMDQQESVEALQPPSRVGQVRQSIASGDFVNSTQGALSSAVREVQDNMAELRKQIHYIAFKIEKRWLDDEKPLIRAVGNRKTYTPSKDLGDTYAHRILFGAAAGLDRQYADVRVLQHVGSGLVSKKTGRGQLDYLDDPTTEQDFIDQEQLSTVLFQRFSADPNTPISSLANALVQMGKGKTLVEVMEEEAKAALEREKQAQAQAAAEAGQLPAGEPGLEPGAEAESLDKGAVPEEGAAVAPIKPFANQPLPQVFIDAG